MGLKFRNQGLEVPIWNRSHKMLQNDVGIISNGPNLTLFQLLQSYTRAVTGSRPTLEFDRFRPATAPVGTRPPEHVLLRFVLRP